MRMPVAGIICALLAVSLGACAPTKTVRATPAPATRKAAPTSAKAMAATLQTQQKHYDYGLRCYTEERYLEAQQAWRKVLELGTQTALAQRSEEYLKKVQRILKTLNELEEKQKAEARQTARKNLLPPPAYNR